MKQISLLSALLIVGITATITSCKSSRVWESRDKEEKEDRTVRHTPVPPPPPRYHSSVSLVISPTPGFVMNRYPDGRYYHRSPQGLLYWKGNDNRFFLDRTYLSRVSYSQWEYNEWKRYSRSQQNNRRY